MTDFSKLLNPEQFAAATAGEGPILVLAAAGTGKTRTLVHRVAYLVEKGVEPWRILLLTFTNRAAREMLDRAVQVVGPDVSSIWSGTFHSICARFLRRWGSALGYKPNFQILDEDEQKKLIGAIIKDSVRDPKDFPKKDVVARMISEAANERKSVQAIAERWQTKVAGVDPEEIAQVAAIYYERKRQMGVMDFDDLLINGLRLLKEKDQIREMLQEHFQYVLVDEYQDTNGLQAEFTDILAFRSRNIMAVGDDFQCIYTWRGAQISNILEFPSRWPGSKIVKLERNYRSLPQILSVANAVMRDAPAQFHKTLKPTRSFAGTRPAVIRVYNGKTQANDIVELVHDALASGYRRGDIAILYRSHFHSIDIEKAVSAARLPYRLTSGVGFYEKEHVKDVLAFLRLMVDSTSELSFLRFIRLLPGVGETSARKAWDRLAHCFTLARAEDRMKLTSILGAKSRPAWTTVDQALAAHQDAIDGAEWGTVANAFIESYYDSYIHRNWEGEEADDRLDDVKELSGDIAEESKPLETYLANVALMTNLDLRRNDPSIDRITLSTVHQAKGMEWPVVIVPWVSEGMFPSARSQEEGRLEEERRLFYVAVTRAKDRLTLITPSMRRAPDGGEFPVGPSMFLREIPRELIDIRRHVDYPQPAYVADGYGSNYGSGGHGSRGGFASATPPSSSAFTPTKRSVADYKKMWRS